VRDREACLFLPFDNIPMTTARGLTPEDVACYRAAVLQRFDKKQQELAAREARVGVGPTGRFTAVQSIWGHARGDVWIVGTPGLLYAMARY
jgi:hypothetical protein